jgi:type IV secretion system T-DNA border endonuclease VirD2
MAFVRNADAGDPISEAERNDIVRQVNERLSPDAIDALRAGNADVLDKFTQDPLRQLELAKTYLQSSEVTAHGPAMERVLDALAEEQIEAQRARHAAADGEKGITHG